MSLVVCVILARHSLSDLVEDRVKIKNLIQTWQFLLHGRDIIDEEYKKVYHICLTNLC